MERVLCRGDLMGYGGAAAGYAAVTAPPLAGITGLKYGAAAGVADGGTITHGLGSTPTWVVAVGSVALNSIAVTAIAATTFTVSIKVDTTGAAGTAQTIYWLCG